MIGLGSEKKFFYLLILGEEGDLGSRLNFLAILGNPPIQLLLGGVHHHRRVLLVFHIDVVHWSTDNTTDGWVIFLDQGPAKARFTLS